jgi:hypothetical protein
MGFSILAKPHVVQRCTACGAVSGPHVRVASMTLLCALHIIQNAKTAA